MNDGCRSVVSDRCNCLGVASRICGDRWLPTKHQQCHARAASRPAEFCTVSGSLGARRRRPYLARYRYAIHACFSSLSPLVTTMSYFVRCALCSVVTCTTEHVRDQVLSVLVFCHRSPAQSAVDTSKRRSNSFSARSLHGRARQLPSNRGNHGPLA